ncbi:MAG: Gfo/Idh/MocA family oxidoreductase [Victivallales bacterium]|nr:Gfo/Idh/MocA family oxidoreductase [Victivallales bacterium]
MPKMNRRDFLATSAAAGAGFTIIPSSVLAGPGRRGANDKINHAIIGVGGMGSGHVGYVLNDPQAKLVAVCDVRKSRREAAAARAKKAGHDCKAYLDFREMIDNEEIDVVHVVTPPHWHALQNIYALNAGCDVWAEKPMTRTIAEGQAVADAVRRNGRVFRLNTWFRLYGGFYGLGSTVDPLARLIRSGLLGWPLTVRVSMHTGFHWKASMWMGKIGLPPQPVPNDLDYDLWLGPAPWKPFTDHRTQGSFRGYWDYDGGGLADMGQHYLDPVQYMLGKDDTSPVEIEATAPWPQHPDAVGLWGQVYMKYADGCKIILESCEWGEQETKGKPYIEGPLGKVYPGFRTEPESLAAQVKYLPEMKPMIKDFNISVRTRQKFGLNEMNGNRSNILVHLANIAIRTGRKLHFDPVTMRFINDPEANRLAEQPMRSPWSLM